MYQPDTWQDWEWWSECWSFVLWAQGYRPKDRVFIPFGYNIFVAFWAGQYAAEKLGCEVVPGGVLDTQSRILKIKELNATAMMATPTYILRMADVEKVNIQNILRDQLRLKTNLGYQIEFYDYGSLPRYEVKAKRFKDLRKKNPLKKSAGHETFF